MTLRPQLWLLLLALAMATFVYWPGLRGPFLFDDIANLEIVQLWLDGRTNWLGAVLGSRDWLTARPVSMAAFTITAWLGDGSSFSYKLGNLVLHLLCGIVAWVLLMRLLKLDKELKAPAAIALATVVLWLVHPLHVSTVLYSVQRMAQLSALFMLAALFVYVASRSALESGRRTAAYSGLFILLPIMVLAGIFSKQNAAIAPALCLVIELAYFQRNSTSSKPVKIFYALFLLTPAAIFIVAAAANPNLILSGYDDWDFTLIERLMSQPRALLDYAGMTLFPRGPRMGLYTDDFATSTGLIAPPTTLTSIVALALLTVYFASVRTKFPSMFAGWFFFLVAHGVESSFIPVELYYEHRNYLPAVGLLLCLCATVDQVVVRASRRGFAKGKTVLCSAIAIAAMLSAATFSRVQIWRDMDSLTYQAVHGRPESVRAAQARAMLLVTKGQLDEAVSVLSPFLNSPNTRSRLLAGIDTLTIKCVRDRKIEHTELADIFSNTQEKVTVGEVLAIRQMQVIIGKFGCGDFDDAKLASSVLSLIDAASGQPNSAAPKAQLQSLVAVSYARAGQMAEARAHGKIAWDATQDLMSADLLARFYLLSDMNEEAAVVISALDERVRHTDQLGMENLRSLKQLLAAKMGP